MKKILFMSIVFLLVCALPIAAGAKQATQKTKNSSCASCHADFSSILPKAHKPVKGGDIAACTACHKPDISGKAVPSSFSATIHRPHVKEGAKTDCTLCHSWVQGKQLGIKGTKVKLGAPSKKQMALIQSVFASWADSSHLDAAHGKADIVCLACHGKTLPEQGDTVENERCLSCHGSLESLAARSAPKDFPDRNPHKSHLGEIACTVCHHGHKPSKVYCLGCHSKFSMKIPGG